MARVIGRVTKHLMGLAYDAGVKATKDDTWNNADIHRDVYQLRELVPKDTAIEDIIKTYTSKRGIRLGTVLIMNTVYAIRQRAGHWMEIKNNKGIWVEQGSYKDSIHLDTRWDEDSIKS